MSLPVPLSPAQRDALLSSSGPARFKHFVGRVADTECVWGLRDTSGWVTLADDSGAMGFPVWPHPDYATACATDIWAGHVPAEDRMVVIGHIAGRVDAGDVGGAVLVDDYAVVDVNATEIGRAHV